jgi:hypothetical protein
MIPNPSAFEILFPLLLREIPLGKTANELFLFPIAQDFVPNDWNNVQVFWKFLIQNENSFSSKL